MKGLEDWIEEKKYRIEQSGPMRKWHCVNSEDIPITPPFNFEGTLKMHLISMMNAENSGYLVPNNSPR